MYVKNLSLEMSYKVRKYESFDDFRLFNEGSESNIDHMFATIDFPSFIPGLYRQLAEEGRYESKYVCPVHEDSKIFFAIPQHENEKLYTLPSAQRVFFTLFTVPLDAESGILALGNPDAYEQYLDSLLKQVDIASIVKRWKTMYNRVPSSFTSLLKRTAGKTTTFSKQFDKSAFARALINSLEKLLLSSDETKHMQPASKNACLTFFTRISARRLTIGIPVLNKRVKQKYVFAHKGVHHSTAWGMARTAKLTVGDVCLDLFCGKASILCESLEYWPEVIYLGSDLDSSQLKCGVANIRSVSSTGLIDLWRGDSSRCSLRDCTVDCIIADLPFGVQMGSVEENKTLYPKVLAELGRLLAFGGRAVLLTSERCSSLIADSPHNSLYVLGRVSMKLGAISCHMILLAKVTDDAATDMHEDDNKRKQLCSQIFNINGIDHAITHTPILNNNNSDHDNSAHDNSSFVDWKLVKPSMVLLN